MGDFKKECLGRRTVNQDKVMISRLTEEVHQLTVKLAKSETDKSKLHRQYDGLLAEANEKIQALMKELKDTRTQANWPEERKPYPLLEVD